MLKLIENHAINISHAGMDHITLKIMKAIYHNLFLA